MTPETLDAIDLQIMWARLISLVDEAALTLARTAFSTLIVESNDFGVVLMDREGHAVAQSSFSIPPFLGTIPQATRGILRKYPQESWAEGDVALTNDPAIGAGHLPDVTVLMPMFFRGRLVGFVGSTAHWADIGGLGFNCEAPDLFAEGLILPPVRIQESGHTNEDLLATLLANSRAPEKMYGDLNAQIDAGTVCGRRLKDFLQDHDASDLKTLANMIQDAGERAMRRSLRNIPSGKYESSIRIDGLDQFVSLNVAVNVDAEKMTVDFGGSSPQVPGPINCPFGYLQALTFHALKCVLDPETPNNDGCYRPITVTAPLGSAVNPRPQAAVNGRHLIGQYASRVIYSALKDVLPLKVIADSGSTPTVAAVFGSAESSSNFSALVMSNGGMGARAGSDGLSCTPFPSNPSCGSMEILETQAPLRILRKELVPDSGGPGRSRGGLGQRLELEVVGEAPVQLSLFVGAVASPPQGLFGGHPGSCNSVFLNDTTPIGPTERLVLRPGDRVTLTFGGGGGYGPPEERNRSHVADDLRKGLITPSAARRLYGYTAL